MYDTLVFEDNGPIAELRLDRADKLNAINRRMIEELADVAARVDENDEVRVMIVSGNGRGFSAGADLSELAAYQSAAESLDHIEWIQRVFNSFEELNVPTIAAIHGMAFGGGLELALTCDFRIAVAGAKLGVPEVSVGLLPGAGGTQRLSHALPMAIAKRMILLGEPITAEEALHHGLINEVVAEEDPLEAARALASRVLDLPPLPIRIGKMLIHGAAQPLLRAGIEAERQGMAFLFATDDRVEGTTAFVEKRKPNFQGR